MSTTLDIDSIIRQAGPVLHQQGHEMWIRSPSAFSCSAV